MMWFPKLLLYIGGAAAVLAAAPSPTFAEQLTISFPTLGAEAATEPVVVVDGQLGVPSDPDRLGVYQVQGNLLVVGHLDWAGQRRVLSMARDFEGGEPIVLGDGRAYHVAWTRALSIDDDEGEWSAAVAPADDVLTLITCTGPFSQSRHMYLERLVVRAVRDDPSD